jgi:hypothetical protein
LTAAAGQCRVWSACSLTAMLMMSLQIDRAVRDRDMALADPSLPTLEFEDIMATIGEKLPIKVGEALYELLDSANTKQKTDPEVRLVVFPVSPVAHV